MNRSEITKHAIAELTLKKARVRQVHNIPIRRRKYHVQPGWSDIQGYSFEGKAILCEVKTENDKLSDEQIDRLNDAYACGCITLIATVNKIKKFHMTDYKP